MNMYLPFFVIYLILEKEKELEEHNYKNNSHVGGSPIEKKKVGWILRNIKGKLCILKFLELENIEGLF